jgi:hypothetical protein
MSDLNLLLITTDQQRWDSLRAAYERARSAP